MLKNTRESFGLIARLLHWIIFFLLIAVITIGITAHEMQNGQEKIDLILNHKSIGLLFIFLVIIRLVWKSINPTPRFLGQVKQQHQAAKLLHFSLYLLMLIQPLTGILMSQAKGYAVSFFGWCDFPTLVDKNEQYAELMSSIHELLWLILVAIVIIHAVAALYHHIYLKDKTIIRMTKG